MRKPVAAEEKPLPIEKVTTPGVATIEALAGFLRVPPARTAKAVLMMAQTERDGEPSERFVFAVIRGDMEVNETKLANAVGALAMRPATAEEILASGAVPGFASPIGIRNALIVADDSRK
jgi:prolyl-tRNA synthetase